MEEDAIKPRFVTTTEEEFVSAVQKGLDDIAAGRVISHEEVVAEWERRKRTMQESKP